MKVLLEFWLIWLLLMMMAVVAPAGYAQSGYDQSGHGLQPSIRFSHLTTATGLANSRVT